jgi:multiple sugar transport system ATP-binding protein
MIEQAGPPQELYHQPGQPVRRRLHRLAVDEFRRRDACERKRRAWPSLVDGTELAVPASGQPTMAHLRESRLYSVSGLNRYRAARIVLALLILMRRVDLVEPLGAATMVYFNIGPVLCATVDPKADRVAGTAALSFNMNRMHLFDPAGGRSLSS